MTLTQKETQMRQHTVEIWMAEPLQYLLITVKVALEKVPFSDTKIPKAVC